MEKYESHFSCRGLQIVRERLNEVVDWLEEFITSFCEFVLVWLVFVCFVEVCVVLAEGWFLVVLVFLVIGTPVNAFVCVLVGSWRRRPVEGFVVGRTISC